MTAHIIEDWRPVIFGASVFLPVFLAGIIWLRRRAGWER